MIIYYHCTSDNALLLSFLPAISTSLSFHEMIFILQMMVLVVTTSEGKLLNRNIKQHRGREEGLKNACPKRDYNQNKFPQVYMTVRSHALSTSKYLL